MHSFRRKVWTSTYLGLEPYLPTSKRCWCREFVKMKIWNLQSLLVCSTTLWRISLARDDWIFGWRSGLASLILNWCLILILHRRWWVNRFWYAWTPWIQFLRMRCRRGRNRICKNVSRKTMRVPNAWRPIFALGIPTERLSIPPGIGWGGKDTSWLVTWECPLRTDSQHLENLLNHSYNKFHFAIHVSYQQVPG